jgi:hypothetical protein
LSQTYRIVKNAINGITATLETSSVVDFDYYPLQISRTETRENLDQSLKITVGDLGEILPNELDLIRTADSFDVKPDLIYRIYRSDDLSEPMDVVKLKIEGISFKKEGAVLDARSPSLNINRTGEIYSFDRFPMLRGFL